MNKNMDPQIQLEYLDGMLGPRYGRTRSFDRLVRAFGRSICRIRPFGRSVRPLSNANVPPLVNFDGSSDSMLYIRIYMLRFNGGIALVPDV